MEIGASMDHHDLRGVVSSKRLIGSVAERLNAPVSKAGDRGNSVRGFKSHHFLNNGPQAHMV